MPIDLLNFVRKWNAATLTERSAAPQHFRDLCEALDVPHPTEVDEIGASYTYEKRVAKAGTGEQGFADVWKRGWFAWEYKSKGGDLKRAYRQLNEYHESLENPPLLIVCDFVHFEVHTKFENAPSRVFAFTLDDLLKPTDTATSALPPIEVLRHVFGDFNKLRPELVSIPVTRAAASDFLRLAQRLEIERTNAPIRPSKEEIAHFLMRLVFCLFADSIDLLPHRAFRSLIENQRHSAISFNRALPDLFEAMSEADGYFGPVNIPYFNGGLFSGNRIIPLDHADLGILASAASHDWSHVEPAIFGTLFERSLDAEKRSMIGAHYTSPEDILLLIEPVVVAPLLRRWELVRTEALAALAAEPPLNKDGQLPASLRANRPALNILQAWAAELSQVRILDPACGSGNFLYLALKRLLDLWQLARTFGIEHGLTLAPEPIPSPTQLFGIEIDFYAHEIASVVVWIGFLQWKKDHGVKELRSPLLQKLTNIERADAILRYDEEGRSPEHPNGKPYEPTWPEAEYIIGNPPFLGGKLLRRELGDSYVDDTFRLYRDRVKAESDLVVYWFEKARQQLERSQVQRVGLLATQAIRGGASRQVLERIQKTGRIFWAQSDRNWTLQGASVHVSMVAFEGRDIDSGDVELNGLQVEQINSDLTTGLNATLALPLVENEDISFMGTSKVGAFELTGEQARLLLQLPLNVNGRPNSDVIKEWANGIDLTRRSRGMYIIDFGSSMSEEEASKYEGPFEYLTQNVKPIRTKVRRENHARLWWLHGESRPGLRKAIAPLRRYIATPRVTKHRLFTFLPPEVVADNQVFVFARDDDFFLGILSSSTHEIWARAQGTQLREVESGFRYTPKTTFDTFPFPWPPGTEPSEADSPLVRAIAGAARELVRLRDAWLNPPDISAAGLRKRTLTNLYNLRAAGQCTWLANAHRTLDRAVFAAYGWPEAQTENPPGTQQILARLLALNHERAAAQPTPPPKPNRAPKT